MITNESLSLEDTVLIEIIRGEREVEKIMGAYFKAGADRISFALRSYSGIFGGIVRH